MRFSEIPGQMAIKEKLIQTVSDQRVSHAQLFYGPESSAKLALAIAYAQYITARTASPPPTPFHTIFHTTPAAPALLYKVPETHPSRPALHLPCGNYQENH